MAELSVEENVALTLLVDRVRSRGITALVATHDLSVAAACDRTIALSEANLAGLAG